MWGVPLFQIATEDHQGGIWEWAAQLGGELLTLHIHIAYGKDEQSAALECSLYGSPVLFLIITSENWREFPAALR